jgi:hypothetical protein
MRIDGVPFTTTDWNRIDETAHPGATGTAYWRTIELGNIRVRMIRYTPAYLADHWCTRGHVVLVLEGELTTELADGTLHTLRPGMSYEVSSEVAPHRSRTATGAVLFVVD